MKKNLITISDNDSIHVPTNVQMRDFEIAELFGVYHQTIRTNIKAVLKSGVTIADYDGGVVMGNGAIIPDYHGLDMVVALAFRIQSYKAEIFRKWVMRKAVEKEKEEPQFFLSIGTKPTDRFIN